MWEPTIGLEVHARLQTRSKLFCGCSTAFGADPNTHVCPVCLGYPGALPVLNKRAVELAIRMAIAAGCEIHEESVFARKNYFYPDLPKGYQISQFDKPLATGGRIDFAAGSVRLHRIHIEEDAGKLIHERDRSLVDLNRSGTPLIEIVSQPDIRSAAEASAYLTRLRQMLMYTGVCDGNMEEGSLRCDANVSVHRPGEPLGTRAEIKNLNSFRFLTWAVEYEITRQISILEGGGKVVQETRLFDPAANETRSMRSKEEAHDYRYFPEPDLLPCHVGKAWIEEIRGDVPPLPAERSAHYQSELGIPAADAEVLVTSRELADFFEAVAKESRNPRAAANWVRNEILRLDEHRITAAMLGKLIRMIDGGAISGKVAKEVFEQMATTGETPDSIVAHKGLLQISDPETIRTAAQKIIASNAAQVEEYRAGNQKVFGFLVGQLMKETRGKANAELANAVLKELLETASPKA